MLRHALGTLAIAIGLVGCGGGAEQTAADDDTTSDVSGAATKTDGAPAPAKPVVFADLVAALDDPDLTIRVSAVEQLSDEVNAAITAMGRHVESSDGLMQMAVLSGLARIRQSLQQAGSPSADDSLQIPPPLTPEQVQSMSRDELRVALAQISRARGVQGLSEEMAERLREDWKLVMARLRERR